MSKTTVWIILDNATWKNGSIDNSAGGSRGSARCIATTLRASIDRICIDKLGFCQRDLSTDAGMITKVQLRDSWSIPPKDSSRICSSSGVWQRASFEPFNISSPSKFRLRFLPLRTCSLPFKLPDAWGRMVVIRGWMELARRFGRISESSGWQCTKSACTAVRHARRRELLHHSVCACFDTE